MKAHSITLPPHYALPTDTDAEFAEAIRLTCGPGGILERQGDRNPIPPAQRSAGIVLADPAIADAAEAYALANGGRVIPLMGFKWVVTAPEERVLWKLRLIGRLEQDRKRREAKPA